MAAATCAGLAAAVVLELATPPRDDRPRADVAAPAPATGAVVAGDGSLDGVVWYDTEGLHHGDQVTQTAVPLFLLDLPGELALVRDGALYDDLATGDVWFHPWAGEPQRVGSDASAGPGGDPGGHVAAWFEGDDLVVYDTAALVVLSRAPAPLVLEHAFRSYVGGFEHVSGNGFMHLSTEEVVWRAADGVHRLDVATGRLSLVHAGSPVTSPGLEDVHGGTRVWADLQTDVLTVENDSRAFSPHPSVRPPGRLTQDGSVVAALWEHGDATGVAFVDVGTGETWFVAGAGWNPHISWSSGDVAVVRVERGTAGPDLELLGCDWSRRTCERLSRSDVPFFVVLPNS